MQKILVKLTAYISALIFATLLLGTGVTYADSTLPENGTTEKTSVSEESSEMQEEILFDTENQTSDQESMNIQEDSDQISDNTTESEAVSEPETIEAIEETVPLQLEAADQTEVIVPSVIYSAHVQTYGWLPETKDGALMGTTGEAKRMEVMQIRLDNIDSYPDSGINYSAHVQTYGWMNPVSNGTLCGTSGQAKRMEAIKIELTGAIAEEYDIYYCVHVQSFGWLAWAKNGEVAGTSGLAKRVESVCIKLVAKGDAAPSKLGSCNYTHLHEYWANYTAHMQTYGWLNTVSNGNTGGKIGQSKRMEALKISLAEFGDFSDSGIKYRGHVEGIGWQNYVSNGAIAGTLGQFKRMEAVQIELTGDISNYYDVYYCTHVQLLGWLGWAKNGAVSGTTGSRLRVEAIKVVILPKGAEAPAKLGSRSQASYANIFPTQIQAIQVLNRVGWNLRSAFNWCARMPYSYYIENGSPGVTHFANYGFNHYTGNCYVYAGMFVYLARELGYETYQISGHVRLANGGLHPHSWTEVNVGNKWYVFDPNFSNERYGQNNGYQIYYGQRGTWQYAEWYRMKN